MNKETSMRLHVVGNGCPQPTPEWCGSAFVLELGDEMVLVDCGPATTYKLARMGIRATQVGRVFLTHHHFDHNVDLPCFALTRWDLSTGGEPPLEVYGPPPTRAFVDRLLGADGAFADDLIARIEHPASHQVHLARGGELPRPGLAIEAADVGPGKVVESDTWAVTAERVHHVEPWLESLVYRFDTDAGSILFAGDCGDCPELRAFAQGVDTLVVACAYTARSGLHQDMTHVITGATEAAEIAQASGVGRVVLTHVSPAFCRPGVKEQAIAEAARIYTGEIQLPDELTTVDLGA
jgi:ribonuclease BN (tRNA processing enzyme)